MTLRLKLGPRSTLRMRVMPTIGLVRAGEAIGLTKANGVTEIAVTNPELVALSRLDSAADTLPFFTAAEAAALTSLTPYARAVLAAANAAAARTTLGVVIGTDVQAHDADLDALAALSTTGLIIRTGAGAAVTRALTGTAAEVAVTNGDGVAGAPTVSLPAALTFTGKAITGGTFSGPTMTGATITLAGDPSAALHAATKQYVDNIAAGLDTKASVRAATTANVTLSGTQTIDGIALVAGDRVLVKNQTAAAGNGIYVVAAGAWARSSDADVWAELPGAYTFVEAGGTTNGGTGWTCNVAAGGTLGTTSVTWAQFWGAGTYTAGTGLTLTGTQFSLSASFSNITGYVLATQFPALTGDVTTTAGSLATTIANQAVTYAKMQNVSATARVLGRKTTGSGSPEELTLSDLLDFIGSAAQGDVLYRGAAGWARLAAGAAGQFLKTLGAGANPAWAAVPGGGDMLAANNLSDVVNKLAGADSLQVVSFGGAQSLSATQQNQAIANSGRAAAWVDAASASTVDLGAVASENVRVTGTVAITSFGTAAAGIHRTLRFAASLVLTYNATSLLLPGEGNITTAANDRCEAISLGSGNWIVVAYNKTNGSPLAPLRTYTPTLGTLAGSYGANPPTASGSYVRIGPLVLLTVNIQFPANYSAGSPSASGITFTLPSTPVAYSSLHGKDYSVTGIEVQGLFTTAGGAYVISYGGDGSLVMGNNYNITLSGWYREA